MEETPVDTPFVTFGCYVCGEVSKELTDHYVHLVSEEHGVTEYDDGRLFCDVCEVFSPSSKHMEDHLKGKKHRKNTDQPLVGSQEMALPSQDDSSFPAANNLAQCDYCLAQSDDWNLMIKHMMVQHSQVTPEDRVEPSPSNTNFILHRSKRKNLTQRGVQVKCEICREICPSNVDQIKHRESHFSVSNSDRSEELQLPEQICVDPSNSIHSPANKTLLDVGAVKEFDLSSIITKSESLSPNQDQDYDFTTGGIGKMLPITVHLKRNGRTYCRACATSCGMIRATFEHHSSGENHKKLKKTWEERQQRDIALNLSSLCTVDEAHCFHCKFCFAKSQFPELMIVHAQRHAAEKREERDPDSLSCFSLDYDGKVICDICLELVPCIKDQMSHSYTHASQQRAPQETLQVPEPKTSAPSEADSATMPSPTIQSTENDLSYVGCDFTSWVLGRLLFVSHDLKDHFYDDELCQAAEYTQKVHGHDELSTFVKDEDADLVSECVRVQIERDGELSGRYCWFCGEIESESVEAHIRSGKHRTSVKMRSHLNYCGICHNKYFFNAKEHATCAFHLKAIERENTKPSLEIPTSKVIKVKSPAEMLSSLQKAKASVNVEIFSNIVFFEFWWHSPRKKSNGKDSSIFEFPPFGMTFKFVSTRKVYAFHLSEYTTYGALPRDLVQFLLSDSYVFVGSLRNVVRLRAGLCEEICPVFLDLCNLCKYVIKTEHPETYGKKDNSTIVRAALYVEPNIRLPPKVKLSLSWTNLIKSEFRFRLDVMNFLWDRMIRVIKSWSRNTHNATFQPFCHNGNRARAIQEIESSSLRGSSNDGMSLESRVDTDCVGTESLSDCVEGDPDASERRGTLLDINRAKEVSIAPAAGFPDCSSLAFCMFTEGSAAYRFPCQNCDELFLTPIDIYDHFNFCHVSLNVQGAIVERHSPINIS